MILLLGDNGKLPLSKAVSMWNIVEFANGNTNFIELLQTHDNKDAIILFDRPGTNQTERVYNNLRYYVLTNCTNVYIVPIVSMEYIAMHSIDFTKSTETYSWLKKVRELIDKRILPKNVPPRVLGYKESFNSLEKMCKLYVNNRGSEYCNILGEGQELKSIANSLLLCTELPFGVYGPEVREHMYNKVINMQKLVDKYVVVSDDLIKSIQRVTLPDKWREEEYK